MGEKGSHKNKIKDFFRILKKKRRKQKIEQEITKKKQEQRKLIKAKFLVLLGYFASIITYPITNSDKKVVKKDNLINIHYSKSTILKKNCYINLKENEQKLKPILNANVKENSQKLEVTPNSILKKNYHSNLKNKSKLTQNPILKKNDCIKLKKNIQKSEVTSNFILNRNYDSNLKNKSKIRLTQDSILKKNNCIKLKENDQRLNPISKKENSSVKKNSPIQNAKSSLKKQVIPKVLIVGGLASHVLGSVSKEIIQNIQEITNINNKIDSISKENEKNKLKKELKEINSLENTKVQSEEKIIKETESKIENKKDIKPILFSINEIESSTFLIKNDIEKEEKEWLYIDHTLKNLEEKKKRKLIPTIIQRKTFDILSIPIPFLKNTWFSKFVHSIIINHRIQRMKKLIHQEYQMKYYNLKKILENIHSQQDLILKNININKNSLEEIQSLKQELLKLNDDSIEVIKANQYLTQLEFNLIKQNKKLKEQLEQNKNLEEKGKEKIKVLEKEAHY